MLFHSLDEIFAHIDEVRSALVSRIRELDEAQLDKRSDKGWSAVELAEHLSMTEKSLTGVVERLLKKSEELNVPASADGKIDPPVKFTSAVRRLDNGFKAEAPERIRPQGGVSIDESLGNLEATREHIKSLRPRMAAFDLSQAKFPHPNMKELDLYQWLVFIAEHEARHLAQLENILKDV